jgi:hypothetical protein
MNPFRSILPVVALAGLAGCSTSTTPDAPSSTGENTATVESMSPTNPGTEASGPEAPRSGDHGVALSIAQLPVGGVGVPDGPLRQCATASWLSDVFPEGGVTVTRIWADPPEGYHVGGSCDGLRGCAGFTFRQGETSCSVAVTGHGTPGGVLKFKGEYTCARGRESSCREVLSRLNQGSVSLDQPEGTTQPASSTTESPTSSPESSPSPSG